jgi:hypothetical protein
LIIERGFSNPNKDGIIYIENSIIYYLERSGTLFSRSIHRINAEWKRLGDTGVINAISMIVFDKKLQLIEKNRVTSYWNSGSLGSSTLPF